jgi:hypothetical protein
MARPTRGVLVVCLAVTGGCSDKQCPAIASLSAFEVVVTDAATGERLCNAEVRVQAHELDYLVRPEPAADGGCSYIAGAANLNAVHTVTVTAPGYKPLATTVFVRGNCLPEWQSVEVRLTTE